MGDMYNNESNLMANRNYSKLFTELKHISVILEFLLPWCYETAKSYKLIKVNMGTFLQLIATYQNVYNKYMLILLKPPNKD